MLVPNASSSFGARGCCARWSVLGAQLPVDFQQDNTGGGRMVSQWLLNTRRLKRKDVVELTLDRPVSPVGDNGRAYRRISRDPKVFVVRMRSICVQITLRYRLSGRLRLDEHRGERHVCYSSMSDFCPSP
ncbi:MAG: hypothetical protein J07HX5_01630 [halophilic archaeon J07HX5]|nr:MAG: hypothetical protein J07HX5_01630 [halophilic archaeon J07HX5]